MARDLTDLVCRLLGEVRPTLGQAGCLLPVWNDLEAGLLLEALGLDQPLEWRRDQAAPDSVRLARPVLGVTVAGGTPEDLMDGLEYLATVADAVLTRLPAGEDAHRVLVRKLRAHFATRPASAPLHVRFRVEEAPAPPPAGRDLGDWREAARHPVVEDHRPFASAREKALRAEKRRPDHSGDRARPSLS